MSYTLQFNYDKRGRGGLILLDCGANAGEWLCRTGSINRNNDLVNALPVGIYILKTQHEDTTEKSMMVDGQAWKTRLYKIKENGDLEYTHLLIHPDGNNFNGTLGCIGVQSLALDLRDKLDEILKKQGKIYLNVGTK